MKSIKVVDAKALPQFRLAVRFSDGTAGTVDLTDDLQGALLGLRNEDLWRQAKANGGGVVWNDDFDLAAEFIHARLHQLPAPRNANDVTNNLLEVTMRELRAMAGKTQAEVAAAMQVAQTEISRLEQRHDTKLSTLQAYVEALGGEIEVVACFGHKRMKLTVG